MRTMRTHLFFVGVALFSLLPSGRASAQKAPPTKPPVQVAKPEDPDPAAGTFNLDLATAGLPGKGAASLSATLEIHSEGKPLVTLRCELYGDKAPLAVANFVGLARGIRPYKDAKTSAWVKRPFYDGMAIHRVIPEFLFQAGDPACIEDPTCMGRAGTGDPGYSFANETHETLPFDRPGRLGMAHRGPGTNGSQFFITEKATPWLSNHYTLFGTCGDVEAIKKITAVPRGQRDLPTAPLLIKKITIARKTK